MPTIITTQIARNEEAASGLCPCIRIHIIDSVQFPGMVMLLDIELHQ